MKFAIFGTGGVGGYFGGRLAQAGQDVTFIARGKHLEAMKTNGLQVDSINGSFKLNPVQVAESLSSLKNVDVIILSTKAWQLTSAIEQIKALADSRLLILPLLNGMGHMDILHAEFGDRVLGGLCRISSFLVEPARVSHVAVNPMIAFNEWKSTGSARVKNLQGVFLKAQGLSVEVPADIELAMWEKYLLICAFSGVGAVTRQPIGVFRAIPESWALFRRALEEVMQVANARGVMLTPDSVQAVIDRMNQTQADMVTSMQKDIMEGRPSELEAQTGAVIRMAHAAGLSVPVHEFIYASLLPMERKARGEG
ncbi:MAG: 2-dehydropantoate 2-reductase [Anaerolineales bacterium]